MPARVIRTRRAENDIAEIADWTVRRFGIAQARRYAGAIEATLHALRGAPQVVGIRCRPDLGPNIWTVPISQVRNRHIVVFSWRAGEQPGTVTVLRILHTAMDLPLHLGPA